MGEPSSLLCIQGQAIRQAKTRKVMMMNYEEMSDFEINKQVAINRGGYQGHVEHMQHGVKESDRVSHGLLFTERDYCNNPSDAWPIILDNHISVINDYGWGACHHRSGIESSMHVNPLKAAMIVFLMMQESK